MDQVGAARLGVVRREAASWAQWGGKPAISLAEPLEERGVPILGSAVEAIDLAEDRRAFAAALEAIGIPQPVGRTTTTVDEAIVIADPTSHPVLPPPSYPLTARSLQLAADPP